MSFFYCPSYYCRTGFGIRNSRVSEVCKLLALAPDLHTSFHQLFMNMLRNLNELEFLPLVGCQVICVRDASLLIVDTFMFHRYNTCDDVRNT